MTVTQQFQVIARIEVVQGVTICYEGKEPKPISEVIEVLRSGQRDVWCDWDAWYPTGDYHNIIVVSGFDDLGVDQTIWEQGIMLDLDSDRHELIGMLEELVWHRGIDVEWSGKDEMTDDEVAYHESRTDKIRAMIDLLRPKVVKEVGSHGTTQ